MNRKLHIKILVSIMIIAMWLACSSGVSSK
jgi:hypothetical protein